MLKNKRLAVLGCGKLGETLIKGLLEAGVIDVADVIVTAGHQQRLEQMRRFARRHALDVMEQQKGSALNDDQAMKVALEAQGWARKRRSKSRTRRAK